MGWLLPLSALSLPVSPGRAGRTAISPDASSAAPAPRAQPGFSRRGRAGDGVAVASGAGTAVGVGGRRGGRGRTSVCLTAVSYSPMTARMPSGHGKGPVRWVGAAPGRAAVAAGVEHPDQGIDRGPAARLRAETAGHDPDQIVRQPGEVRLSGRDPVYDCRDLGVVEGTVTGRREGQDRAEAGHVRGGADGPVARPVFGRHEFGAQQHIRGLEVPVQDSRVVDAAQRPGEVQAEPEHRLRGKQPSGPYGPLERRPGHVLGRQPGRRRVRVPCQQPGDEAAVGGPCRRDLLPESLTKGRIARRIGPYGLHGGELRHAPRGQGRS